MDSVGWSESRSTDRLEWNEPSCCRKFVKVREQRVQELHDGRWCEFLVKGVESLDRANLFDCFGVVVFLRC